MYIIKFEEKYEEKWENAYLTAKNARASRGHGLQPILASFT